MKYIINKIELVEEFEKIKLNTPERIQKFSQRSANMLNNKKANNSFKIGGYTIPGAAIGGLIGSSISDGDDGDYIGTGALLGAAVPAGLSMASDKPANMNKVGERLRRDGYKVNDRRMKTLNGMSSDAFKKAKQDIMFQRNKGKNYGN